jgi:polysaccharide biosynthesis/export protein
LGNFNISFMKNICISISKILILFIFLSVLLSSCVSQKKIKYLQQKEKEDTNTYFEANKSGDYKIQPKDNLYIRIMSLDERTNALFNSMSPSTTGGNANQESGIFLTSYSVSDEGYIEFPILGKVFVKELTVEQTKNLLQQLVDEYIKEAVVIVKMVNFKITVLGEAHHPGELSVYQNKINIFEAISQSGDLTDFADRKNVILVRQVKGGSKIHYLDLTSNKILSSDLYYMSPNDILYISPLRAKQFGFATFPYAMVFSSITLILTLITFFKIYNP